MPPRNSHASITPFSTHMSMYLRTVGRDRSACAATSPTVNIPAAHPSRVAPTACAAAQTAFPFFRSVRDIFLPPIFSNLFK
ncbi:MAG: hypothetical protein [Inoviridae sp.]|nr:MAG: hypothetical protein [Inoviridae sp.]